VDLSILTKEQLIEELEKSNQIIARLQLQTITKNEDYNQPLYTKAFLQEVINQVADPIFVKNEQHRWVLLNDSFCSFIGYDRKELIAEVDHKFFPKEQSDIFWAKDEEILSTGKININTEIIDDAQGNTHTIITKKRLFVDNIGSKFIVGLIHDITK